MRMLCLMCRRRIVTYQRQCCRAAEESRAESFRIMKMKEDGRCMFRAIGAALQLDFVPHKSVPESARLRLHWDNVCSCRP